jgi:hypothetical protein
LVGLQVNQRGLQRVTHLGLTTHEMNRSNHNAGTRGCHQVGYIWRAWGVYNLDKLAKTASVAPFQTIVLILSV